MTVRSGEIWNAEWLRYVLAVAVIAATEALASIIPALRDGGRFLMQFGAVLICGLAWGSGPGLLVITLSLLWTAGVWILHAGTQPPFRDVAGLGIFACVCGFAVALSERWRRARQRLQQSERRFRLTVEHTSDLITILDRQGTIQYQSPSVQNLLGFKVGELVGRSLFDLVHPEDAPAAVQFFDQRLHTTGKISPLEFRLRCADGSYRLMESAASVLLDAPRQFGIVLSSRDLSERARAAESMRALLQSAPDAIIGMDHEGRIALVNEQAENIFGYTREELLGAPIEMLMPAKLREIHVQHRHAYASSPEVRPMGARLPHLTARRKDGTEFPAEISLSPIRTERGLLVTSIIRDTTERRKAEEARAELIREQAARAEAEAAQRRFHDLVQDLDAIVWECDLANNRLTFVSRRAERLLGYATERWVGAAAIPEHHAAAGEVPWLEHVYSEDRERVDAFLQSVAAGDEQSLEYRAIASDGRPLWLRLMVYVARDENGQAQQVRGLAVDVTERKHAEEALRTSEKLAATGRLAASIAHEINNPMGAVTNLLYLIESQAGDNEEVRKYARLGQDEMRRVAHITRQMLAFYRDAVAPRQVDLAELFESTLELYRRRLRDEDIQVDSKYFAVPLVYAFPGEVRQVFSNLLLNAMEAVGKQGRIRVKVRSARDWADSTRTGVRVTIADNGPGIQLEDRSRIFEPFFTTKGANGTGLGLWVSEGIVRKHGGSLRVHSSPRPARSGSCFSLFLPVDAELQAPRAKKAAGSAQGMD